MFFSRYVDLSQSSSTYVSLVTIRLPNLSQGGKGGLPKSEEEKGHGRKSFMRKENRESAEKSRNEKTIQGWKASGHLRKTRDATKRSKATLL